MTNTPNTYKAGGATVGLGVGNGLAYFLLWYGRTYHSIEFEDPLLAMAMLGGIMAALLLQLKRLGAIISYVFDRMFPPQKKKDS